MRTAYRALAVAGAVVALGGGGFGVYQLGTHNTSSRVTTSSTTSTTTADSVATIDLPAPTPTPDDQLSFTAEHQGCGDLAALVYQYLQTGSPHTETATDGSTIDLDQQYGQERAQILTAPQDAQDGLMQAQARSAGEQCDQSLDQQAAQQAQAQAQQEAQQAQAQAAQQLMAAQEASCAAIGGVVSGSRCDPPANNPACNGISIDIPGFNADGSIDRTKLGDAQTDFPGCYK